MEELIDKLKQDLKSLSVDAFFDKYYLNDNYWYFEHVLKYEDEELLKNVQEFKNIISEHFQINKEKVFLVGSAKIGVSLSPQREGKEAKLYKKFRIDGENPSDLDVAIISEKLFNIYWNSYRNAKYYSRYQETYKHVYNETYRGYINSKNLVEIDEGRKLWNDFIKLLYRKLQRFFIKNEIQFRIYRNLNDFLQYHHQGINKIRRV